MRRLRTIPLYALVFVASWFDPNQPTARAADPTPTPTFAANGVAFVKANCVACHGADKARADLTLHDITDDAGVLKDRKTWERVVEVIREGEMPPANKPQPPLAEKEQFAKIVEGIFDRADSSGVVDPGRVTMRRLNRTEYNNTIRDLCYVDFDASEDFPSDDIGHGFDNIGDVLSLPPVLMERYLAAAESAMSRAIVTKPPAPPTRTQRGRFLEPASRNVPLSGSWRVMTVDPKGDAIRTGPVHTPFKVPPYGEYVFRVKVYAETKDSGPVKIALLAQCDGDAKGVASDAEAAELTGAAVKSLRPFVILKVAEVTARDSRKAQTIEVAVPAGVKITRGAVAIITPEKGATGVKLYVDRLSLEGPLDPRPPSHRKLLDCDPKAPKPEQTRQVVERFVTRAYRRPASPEEISRVVALVDAAEADGKSWEEAVQFAFTGVLCSPKFLFRIESDPSPVDAGPHPVGEHQLASRLSYFLWATMPDEELFRLAAENKLSANLEAQARRMLADPRADALVDRFAVQWLQLERLQSAQVDPELFPKFDEQMKRAMLEETRLFFREIVREDHSVLDIISGNYTYLNRTLADLYGIKDTAGNTWAMPKSAKPLARRQVVPPPRRVRPRGPVEHPPRRRFDPGQRTDRNLIADPDIAGETGQMGARTATRHAAPAAAAGRARTRRERQGDHVRHAPRAAGRTPQEPGLCELSRQDGPDRLRPGEFRRDRSLPLERRGRRHRRVRRSRQPGIPRPGRTANRAGREERTIRSLPGRENANLRPRPRFGIL